MPVTVSAIVINMSLLKTFVQYSVLVIIMRLLSQPLKVYIATVAIVDAPDSFYIFKFRE